MPTQVYFLNAPVNTYTLYIAVTVLAGGAWSVAWSVWTLGRVRGTWTAFSETLNALLIGAACAYVAGRAGYVLLNLGYFREHLDEVVSTASPGLWEQAAIAGGLAGWWIARALRQRAPPNAYVALATLAGIGASGGCIANGCAYGREVFWTDGWLWSLRVDWPDAYLTNNPRLPAQELMIIWLLVCFIAVWVARVRRWRVTRSGGALLLWTALFACGDFAIQFARADGVATMGPLRLPQWADASLAIACAFILCWHVSRVQAPELCQASSVNETLW